MTLFSDLYTGIGLPALLEMSGQAITYTYKSATTVCTAIVGPVEQDETEGADGQRTSTRKRTVILQKSAVPEAKRTATLTIDSETWSIRSIDADSESTVAVTAVFISAIETASPGYRKG